MNKTDKQPLISVVVPVYQVEQYLRQCLDSILAQTLTDIEAILVDDGSPDNCPAIIDEYAASDSRVVAIHQKNGGYGKALNRGFAAATGEYTGIIESDDWIKPEMYETLYDKAVRYDADVAKCWFYNYDSHASETKLKPFGGEKYFSAIRNAPHGAFSILDYPVLLTIHPSIWAALYRTSFIQGVKAIETPFASYQDFPFMLESLCRAKRIVVVP